MTGTGPLHRMEQLVSGRTERNLPLAPFSAFKVGGRADLYLEPESPDEVRGVLRTAHEEGVPVFVLGGGTNLLIRDGGIRGVVIRLGKVFRRIRIEGHRLLGGGMASMTKVALAAEEVGLGGLEFGYDIPGTVGGALRMNAGAHGSDVSRVLAEASGFDEGGGFHRVPASQVRFGYRTAIYPCPLLFTEGIFALHPEDREALAARRKENHAHRLRTQPKGKTVGSIFKNPEGDHAGRLVDAAGLKGKRVGGARVSEKHGNWILNEEGASARDIESLIRTIQEAVRERFEVDLEPEVRIVGEPVPVPERSS